MVGADVVGCVVWAGVNDIWIRGVLHVFIKAAHESCQITPIPQRHFSVFSHNLLKKGPESDPTCRDFGVTRNHMERTGVSVSRAFSGGA